MSFNDILQPFPIEKWSLLADTLKIVWPPYAQYYYFIQTAMKWKSKDPNIPISIYCPDGDHNSGIFVAVSSYTLYFIITFAHEGFEELLYKAVTTTNFIDWSKGVFFAAVHSRIIPTVYSIIEFLNQKYGIEIKFHNPGKCFFKSKEKCTNVQLQIPDDCYLKELNETHVSLIHSVWPHRNEENPELTTRQVLSMIKFNGGLGLFSKETKQLLLWAVQSETGAISLVQTIEHCKRKGYGKLITNAFAKQLSFIGIDSFVFIVDENNISKSMFKSLDFELVHENDWIQMTKIQ
ncbi:uncharacterized protein LOC127288983 [Leptopilina boulardi]|uniref:uncharacterized protein LOC127288983 n=1 Tax=Leptopilina boulardi TaxID=63433 RepID=UPI0021F644C0|nr:uncharacterized protein LOC127288983 [Leptopilina boulardi]